jgi:hypothetical protein
VQQIPRKPARQDQSDCPMKIHRYRQNKVFPTPNLPSSPPFPLSFPRTAPLQSDSSKSDPHKCKSHGFSSRKIRRDKSSLWLPTFESFEFRSTPHRHEVSYCIGGTHASSLWHEEACRRKTFSCTRVNATEDRPGLMYCRIQISAFPQRSLCLSKNSCFKMDPLLLSGLNHPSLNVLASLKVITFSSLLNSETRAIADLHKAGVENGFFYLDLRNPQTQTLLDEVERLYGVAESIFRLPLEEKLKYDLDQIGPAKIDGSEFSTHCVFHDIFADW